MGLLPCLRRGSDRWWLPRGGEATEVIGRLMLADGRLDAATRQTVAQTLCQDPPLLIFAALHWPGEQATLSGLVDWLAQNAVPLFASGEAFLGAPVPTAEDEQNVQRLRDYFRTLPLERWLPEAGLWLELTGPDVPASWKEEWPTLEFDSLAAATTSDMPPGGMLQEVARLVQQTRSMQRAFDARLHSSKLAALKQLAYGLSHEINNPLANISTRAQQLQRGESDPSRAATLQRIIDQVYRAHQMIADLMFYANPPAHQLQRCDLNRVLQEVADSFREEAKRQAIRLELSATEEVVVSADPMMIEEAVRALVRNAVDAIGCQGTIVISLAHDTDRVFVHVADSGPGLSDLAREHAFDPYFSGREAGRGLGLGLCRAFRIADLHHGEVTLAGGPAGCVATISLPTSQS